MLEFETNVTINGTSIKVKPANLQFNSNRKITISYIYYLNVKYTPQKINKSLMNQTKRTVTKNASMRNIGDIHKVFIIRYTIYMYTEQSVRAVKLKVISVTT